MDERLFVQLRRVSEDPHQELQLGQIYFWLGKPAEGQKIFESLETESLFAFPLGGEVEEQEQIPVLDTAAEQGPIEGAVVLFLLPDDTSQNRPLILEIHGPEGATGEVTLDL